MLSDSKLDTDSVLVYFYLFFLEVVFLSSGSSITTSLTGIGVDKTLRALFTEFFVMFVWDLFIAAC